MDAHVIAPAAVVGATVATLTVACALAARRYRRRAARATTTTSSATQTMPEFVLVDPDDMMELAARPPAERVPKALVQQLQQMAVDDLHSMAAACADARTS